MGRIADLWKKHREGLLYIICGGFTVLVSLGSYALFVWGGIDPNISNILSWICGVAFAFVVNKWIVFVSRSLKRGIFLKELGSFFGSRIFTGVIAMVLFPILTFIGLDQSLFGTELFLARITVSGVEIVLNYFLSKFVVFRNKLPA